MALRQGTSEQLRGNARQLRVLPTPPQPAATPARAPQTEALGDEFLFAGKARVSATATARAPARPRRLLLLLAVLAVAGLLVFAVRSLTASKPAPAAAPVHTTAPVVSAVPAAPAPAGVPMTIVSSVLSPAAGGYRAVVTIRNPTDVTADSVTVTLSLRDASGREVATQTRTLDTLASGETQTITVDGEQDPAPTGLEVSAVAAQLEAHA
jgi:uncharacterized protein (TIGR02588 family)